MVAVMAVAQPAHFNAGFPGHQGCSVENRVSREQNPSIWTELFHIPRDIEHEQEVMVFEHPGTVVEISVFGGHFPASLHEVFVVRNGGRINDEVGVFEALFSAEGTFKIQIGAKIFGIAQGKPKDCVENFLVDIHEAYGASVQSPGQAHVFHEAEGEDDATRAENSHFYGHLDPFQFKLIRLFQRICRLKA